MCEWRRICCPVDFSEPSRAAFEHAAGMALRSRGALLLVHVQRRNVRAQAVFAPPSWRGAAERSGDSRLTTWTQDAQQLVAGLAISVELAGDPAKAIVCFASEFDCDLIVLGTQARRTSFGAPSLGPVAQGILRAAHCPVLVVRA
jgi:nucleotide-binding universal stress UspA family protein